MRIIGNRWMVGLLFASVCVPGGANGQAARTDSNVRPREARGTTVDSERDEQESLFNYYFREQGYKYQTVLAKLETEASVPAWRIPYSAAIHPESGGGMSDVRSARPAGLFARRGRSAASGSSALSLYDRAFNGGEGSANSYEIQRIMGTTRALFPGLRMRQNTESWEGYCSGFTASTIKHPEPVRAVDAGDVGYYRCVVTAGCGLAISDEVVLIIDSPVYTPADFDLDGDVDLSDFASFRYCYNGPNQLPTQPSSCGVADLDGDVDVDLSDFAVFQTCFNGPNQPPACL